MRLLTAVLCATGVVGCSSAPPPTKVPDGAPVQVHNSPVRATIDADSVAFTVIATFTNVTADTLRLHPCVQQSPFPPVVSLERKEGETWKAAWSPVCTQALMLEPPSLAPGASRTDTLRIWASRRPNSYPEFPEPVTGTYRLVYGDVYRKWYSGNAPAGLPPGANSLGDPAPDSVRRSSAFEIIR